MELTDKNITTILTIMFAIMVGSYNNEKFPDNDSVMAIAVELFVVI